MEVSSAAASGLVPDNSAARRASASLANNFDDFLTLLTTQLTHQDPLSPTDSTEFTNQLVNFTSVEQTIATNQNLEALIELQLSQQQTSESATLINYLGKTVGSDIPVAALQNGQANWDFNLGSSAAEVNISIYDQYGTKVKSEALTNLSGGANSYVWDGLKYNGQAAPEGTYVMQITATSAGGSGVEATHNFKGVATGVESENGVPVLKVNGVSLPLSSVRSVHITEDSTSTT